MIISFSITAKRAEELKVKDPLFAGIKTVTRRHWSETTYSRITQSYDHNTRIHPAWTNCSFVPGAKPLGAIELTHRPYLEKLGDMPEEDVYHEGNLWKSKEEFIEMLGMKPDSVLTVVRFRFIPVITSKTKG
jgi:hypothetical protein